MKMFGSCVILDGLEALILDYFRSNQFMKLRLEVDESC